MSEQGQCDGDVAPERGVGCAHGIGFGQLRQHSASGLAGVLIGERLQHVQGFVPEHATSAFIQRTEFRSGFEANAELRLLFRSGNDHQLTALILRHQQERTFQVVARRGFPELLVYHIVASILRGLDEESGCAVLLQQQVGVPRGDLVGKARGDGGQAVHGLFALALQFMPMRHADHCRAQHEEGAEEHDQDPA